MRKNTDQNNSKYGHFSHSASYEEPLEKNASVSIHYRNIQALAMEMYRVKSGYTPKVFSDLFNQREISSYNFRRHPEFRVPLTKTVYHWSESISYLGLKI